MKIDLSKLENRLNIKFSDKKIIIKSITHKSYDATNNYEKLEFLGDRVLGLIISKKLFEMFPNEKEGILDKKLASLVNKKTCLQISKSLELEKFILVSNNKNNENKIEEKIIADCCEAIIGGIFIDQGYTAAQKFVLNNWKIYIKKSVITFVDAKTKLQEYSLKKFKCLPSYKLIKNSGPRHKPTFIIGVKLIDTKLFKATGFSKKDAEQKAASLLLKKLN